MDWKPIDEAPRELKPLPGSQPVGIPRLLHLREADGRETVGYNCVENFTGWAEVETDLPLEPVAFALLDDETRLARVSDEQLVYLQGEVTDIIKEYGRTISAEEIERLAASCDKSSNAHEGGAEEAHQIAALMRDRARALRQAA